MGTKETVYNLFVFTTLDLVTEVGVAAHEMSGTDEEKITALQACVEADLDKATRFSLPESFQIKQSGQLRNGIDYTSYRDLCNQEHALLIFKNAHLPEDALVVITPVKNGKIYVEGAEGLKTPESAQPGGVLIDKQSEWYVGYIDDQGFHFDRLINDDFMDAVRILYNARHSVSALKLLMITLDTMAYLEYGDIRRNFQNWLDTYADLPSLGITSDELKEFRNSLLHMTNLDSRKVQSKSVKRLLFYDAPAHIQYAKETDEGKYFKILDLIHVVAWAISGWAESYNVERAKFEIFLARYDRIISDKRMTFIHYQKSSSV